MGVDGASFLLLMCRRYGGENAVQIICSTTNIAANRESIRLMMCEYDSYLFRGDNDGSRWGW